MGDGDALASGTGIRFTVTAEDDAFLYVIAIGSSGRAILLFPFSGSADDALTEAAVSREVPGEGDYLPLDNQVGREQLLAVAAPRPIQGLDALLRDLEATSGLNEAKDLLRARLAEVAAVSFRHVSVAGTPAVGASSSADTGETPAAPAGRDWLFGSRDASASLEGNPGGEQSIEVRALERTPRARASQSDSLSEEAPRGAAAPAPSSIAAPTPSSDSPFGAESEPGVLVAAGSKIRALLGEAEPRRADASAEVGASDAKVASAPVTSREASNNPIGTTVLVVTPRSIASGVLLSDTGHILVPYHAVRGTGSVRVLFPGTDRQPNERGVATARLVQHLESADIAVIAVNETGLNYARLATSDDPQDARLTLVGQNREQQWITSSVELVGQERDYAWTSPDARARRASVLRLQAAEPSDFLGAPIYDQTGALRALVVSEQSGELIAINTATLRRFLRDVTSLARR
ncbi:MAG: DUF4384 domain-containing protein [Pseudomonadota bacterium]